MSHWIESKIGKSESFEASSGIGDGEQANEKDTPHGRVDRRMIIAANPEKLF
jgi:hypothetical protein